MTLASVPSLRHNRPFVLLWSARLVGILANQMLMVALAWHMYDLTSSAWDLGLVGLLQFIPALLLTLPAGHVADVFNRARITATCLGAQALVAAILVLATLQAWADRELIFALSVILGAARAFHMPAQQALTPQIVPAAQLHQAVSVSAGGMQVAVIAGPALGGVLYGTGAVIVYGLSLALLLLSTALMFGVQVPPSTRARQATSWRSVLAGVGFIWERKLLLGATSLDLFAVLLGGATALLPIFARDILHTGPEGLGLLRASPALGAFACSLVMLRWPLQRRVGVRLLRAVGVFGLATIVFGMAQNFWLAMVALVVTGAADTVSMITRTTLMQLETPDQMRGRVSAVNSIFIGASNQLGEFESGATAALMGPVAAVVLGGVGSVLVAVGWSHWFPELSQRDHLHPQPTHTD